MVDFSITNWRYGYLRDNKWPSEAVDFHHVFVLRKRSVIARVILFSSIVLTHALSLLLLKEKLVFIVFSSFLLEAFLIKWLLGDAVDKESVVVLPAFGVQLETHYSSGKVTRRFVPVDKILKPILTECVTPVTCYWNLSLIVSGEAELMLVFKELRPPLKMLVPIWKALFAASDTNIAGRDVSSESG